MATQLGIYNAALLEIGERSLASITEARDSRRALDDGFSDVALQCLAEGQWKFSQRAVEVAADDVFEPMFGFAYSFAKPDDLLRLTGLSSSDRMEPPLFDYREETGYWFADIEPIWVRYVSSDADYGMNLAAWPALFDRWVTLELAARVCQRITQSESKLERIEKRAKKAKLHAQSVDAQGEPPKFMPLGSWVASRSGGRFQRHDRA